MQIHFEDRSGIEFERLTFAYVSRLKNWDKLEWLGQTGGDGGRDIWGVSCGESYCYQCANYTNMTTKKGKEDLNKLVIHGTIPDNNTIVCGGHVSNKIRDEILNYAISIGIKKNSVWNGVEFEEFLRRDTPEIIERFVNGIQFPDNPKELIFFAKEINGLNDKDIVDLIIECFDRPAFTTRFYRESNLQNFEKAIEDTINVLNTGMHRLRDGTLIRQIPSRHRISNPEIKKKLADITKLVIRLRDDFTDLKKRNEIERCGCGDVDCQTYMMSDKACTMMDNSRQMILNQLKLINPDLKLIID